MRKQILLFLILIFSILNNNNIAQSQAAFESLTYPRTLTSSGMGEQGVTSRIAVDAMQYNPANLTYTNGTSFSFYRNPWQIMGFDAPLTSLNVSGVLPHGGYFGLEYTDWDLGDITTAEDPFGNFQTMHVYQRSLAAGYAMYLNDNLSVGAQLRYAWQPIASDENLSHLLISLGMNYSPSSLDNRLNVGLSFMNLGTKINYDYNSQLTSGQYENHTSSEPPPAQLNIGINGLVVTNDYFDLTAMIGVKKPLDKLNGPPDYGGQSSFQSLFTDWDNFPNDMTLQTGIGYIWHPIYLGKGISLFQEFYLGYFTIGPEAEGYSFYTHGFDFGVSGYGFKASAGYAGRWHNNNATNFITWRFPWETFQFNLSTELNIFKKEGDIPKTNNLLHNIILSGGFTYGSSTGRMQGANNDGVDISLSSKSNWLIESDFYLNERSAIFSVLSYSRMTETYGVKNFQVPFFPQEFSMDFGIETFSLESGFRYHPIESLNQFFVQGSFGVIRLNFVLENTTPRYNYKTFDRIAAGYLIPMMDTGIMVIPKIGLRTIFMEARINGNNLVGFNQIEFGVNLGYKF